MKTAANNFFTSGWNFDESELDLKSRYHIINLGLLLSSLGLIYGMVGNILRDTHGFLLVESVILFINFVLIFVLRKYKNKLKEVIAIMTVQFTFLFLFLVYVAQPDSMKHTWLFTYPILLLYFQDIKKGLYWIVFFIFMLMISPLQGFIEVKYSMYQVSYLSIVLIVVHTIIYFYHLKMVEAKDLIVQQQKMLMDFNSELEKQVKEKTSKLVELNEFLEIKVEEKLEELRKKDNILEAQAKQAVMGEMIAMIAHQWRQPLSTVTLQIANLQFKKLLGKDTFSEDTDHALSEISDTIIYLSETVDDFQTYFRPNKEMGKIEIHELLQRAVNFSASRITDKNIKISINKQNDIFINTYINEFVQVVLNILNNAIDAHNSFKTKEPFVSISVEEADGSIFVHIEDNAGGIKNEDLPRLFEPYFSTKGKNGTGLGLYMSQMIIQKQFGGEIYVKTSHNGSTFSINVPKNI